jgi:hypothetical protein
MEGGEVRKAHEEALGSIALRCNLSPQQVLDISINLASTHGPLVIAAFIENGLRKFRELDKEKRNKKRKAKP